MNQPQSLGRVCTANQSADSTRSPRKEHLLENSLQTSSLVFNKDRVDDYEYSKRLRCLAQGTCSRNYAEQRQESNYLEEYYLGAKKLLKQLTTNEEGEEESETEKKGVPRKVEKRRKSSCGRKQEHSPRRLRGKLTSYQLRYLERKYQHHKTPEIYEINGLAKALQLTEAQVRAWFQNRQSKDKNYRGMERSLDFQRMPGPPTTFEFSKRLLALTQSSSHSCKSTRGFEHCCHCVQSFECFWPRSNLQTIRMNSSQTS